MAQLNANISNRPASVYGRGDQELVELAQAGKAILPDKLPNSDTAARAYMQYLPGAAVGASTYAATGDVEQAAKFGAGTYALPRAIQAAMNSPAAANYLAQGISPGTLRQLLSAPENRPLLAAMLRAAPAAYVVPAVRS